MIVKLQEEIEESNEAQKNEQDGVTTIQTLRLGKALQSEREVDFE